MELYIDNWRWDGVPVSSVLARPLEARHRDHRSVQEGPPGDFPRHAGGGPLESNRLLFHIQPDQGIEVRFQAKTPGPTMFLQQVNMRFDYREAFEAAAAPAMRCCSTTA